VDAVEILEAAVGPAADDGRGEARPNPGQEVERTRVVEVRVEGDAEDEARARGHRRAPHRRPGPTREDDPLAAPQRAAARRAASGPGGAQRLLEARRACEAPDPRGTDGPVDLDPDPARIRAGRDGRRCRDDPAREGDAEDCEREPEPAASLRFGHSPLSAARGRRLPRLFAFLGGAGSSATNPSWSDRTASST
jgi:hypothetical protein